MIKKRFILFVLMVLISFCTLGCNKDKAIIMFNRNPITKETLLKNTKEFMVGEKIYYIFISQKPIKSTFLKVQIMKENENVEFWEREPIYMNDHRLYRDQVYYFNDYLVLHERGHYMMLVFLKGDQYQYKPLAVSDFFVR